MAYQVIARKYRPQSFKEVVGQEHITRTLENALRHNRIAHAYLFSGSRGVGKTSVARILAKALNCNAEEGEIPCNRCTNCVEITQGFSMDVVEIDGASNRGIDEIRDLREKVKYMPSSGRYKIYIIDEVHMLTKEAFNALLKTLEEPPEHVKFFFATTEPHKVPLTILSRCQRFDFKRIPQDLIIRHLRMITEREGIRAEEGVFRLIAREAEGSMRDAQSLLDQVISFSGDMLRESEVIDILGLIDRKDLNSICLSILEGRTEDALKSLSHMLNYGYEIHRLYQEIMNRFREMLMALFIQDRNFFNLDEKDYVELREQAEFGGEDKLRQILNMMILREQEVRYCSHPRIVMEILIVELCKIGELESLDKIIKRISEIERKALKGGGREYVIYKRDDEVKGDIDQQDKDWEGFLNFLSSKYPPLYAMLKKVECLGIEGGCVKLKAGQGTYLMEDKTRVLKFKEVLKEFFDTDLDIEFIKDGLFDIKREDKNSTPNYPQIVKDVIGLFEGEIEEII